MQKIKKKRDELAVLKAAEEKERKVCDESKIRLRKILQDQGKAEQELRTLVDEL